jgi:hypothetical protein
MRRSGIYMERIDRAWLGVFAQWRVWIWIWISGGLLIVLVTVAPDASPLLSTTPLPWTTKVFEGKS